MSSDLIAVISKLLQQIGAFNAAVARKLSIAIEQLEAAKSVEEYQQIGILARDALIEFGQSIYRENMVSQGATVPSNSDAKRMIKYALDYYVVDQEYLGYFVKTCYDYANAIQHDSSVKRESVVRVLSMTTLCIALVIESVIQSDAYTKRSYYKCPNCGSLELEVREHWEADYDGAFKMDKLVCAECGWFYIEELGGVSGVE